MSFADADGFRENTSIVSIMLNPHAYISTWNSLILRGWRQCNALAHKSCWHGTATGCLSFCDACRTHLIKQQCFTLYSRQRAYQCIYIGVWLSEALKQLFYFQDSANSHWISCIATVQLNQLPHPAVLQQPNFHCSSSSMSTSCAARDSHAESFVRKVLLSVVAHIMKYLNSHSFFFFPWNGHDTGSSYVKIKIKTSVISDHNNVVLIDLLDLRVDMRSWTIICSPSEWGIKCIRNNGE